MARERWERQFLVRSLFCFIAISSVAHFVFILSFAPHSFSRELLSVRYKAEQRAKPWYEFMCRGAYIVKPTFKMVHKTVHDEVKTLSAHASLYRFLYIFFRPRTIVHRRFVFLLLKHALLTICKLKLIICFNRYSSSQKWGKIEAFTYTMVY